MKASIATLHDNTLIELALAGQNDCFSVLIQRHTTAVRNRVSSVVRNPSDIEDLVQNALLKAWLRLSTFRFEATFRTWLISIALKEAFAFHRSRKCGIACTVVPTLDKFPSPCGSPHQAFASNEARTRVRTAISRLPHKYRQVLVLFELEQLNTKETAERLEASIPLVKARLFRARRMLSTALNQHAASAVGTKAA